MLLMGILYIYTTSRKSRCIIMQRSIKEEDIKKTIVEYANNEYILKMKQCKQHKHTSTYNHSISVAIMSYSISDFFNMKPEEKNNVVVGAMLHDFSLYDWRKSKKKYLHLWRHTKMAVKNAETIFGINEKQKNIIESHMFPITLLHPPKYACAWIVSLADKICTVKELISKNNVYITTPAE